MSDMPDQPKTVQLPAMTDRALLEDLARNPRETKGAIERLTATVDGLVGDHQSLHMRMGSVEGRIAKLESVSINPPPPPITSDRIRAVVHEHTSQADLEQQAKLAEVIIKDQERDRRIEETHALALSAATKEDVQKLADTTASKAEVKELVDAAADAQTEALIARLNAILSKPYVKLAITALGAFITGWLASHGVNIK